MSILESGQQAGHLAPVMRAQPTVEGWFDDPEAQHRMRYFDGHHWTDHVTHYGPTPCAGCG